MNGSDVPEIQRFSVRCKVPFSGGTWTLLLSPKGSMVRFEDHEQVVAAKDEQIRRANEEITKLEDAYDRGTTRERERAEKSERLVADVRGELERRADRAEAKSSVPGGGLMSTWLGGNEYGLREAIALLTPDREDGDEACERCGGKGEVDWTFGNPSPKVPCPDCQPPETVQVQEPQSRALITVFHDPGIGFDSPILAEAEGVPLASVVDRVRAGEDVGAVAIDFGIKPESARLIVAIADACSTQPSETDDASTQTNRPGIVGMEGERTSTQGGDALGPGGILRTADVTRGGLDAGAAPENFPDDEFAPCPTCGLLPDGSVSATSTQQAVPDPSEVGEDWPERCYARFEKWPDSPWEISGTDEQIASVRKLYAGQGDVELRRYIPAPEQPGEAG